MITEQHEMETLNRAYVHAVAGAASVVISKPDPDYGIDGTFRDVATRVVGNERKFWMTGYPLDFQLKASTDWTLNTNHLVFDLEATAYNNLVISNNDAITSRRATPCILIVLCLPKNKSNWVDCDENRLILQKCCYWEYLTGNQTTNVASKRIKINKSKQFTPASLRWLLDEVQSNSGIFN